MVALSPAGHDRVMGDGGEKIASICVERVVLRAQEVLPLHVVIILGVHLHSVLIPLSGVLTGGAVVAPMMVPTMVVGTASCILVKVGSPLVCPPGSGSPF